MSEIVKNAAYYAVRCWFHDCEELRDPASEQWCTAHLAGRPIEVERAVEWLADLGYDVDDARAEYQTRNTEAVA